MGKVITVHSFRRAAGRSSLTANLCVLLAQKGYRLAALDTDFQAPSLHLFLSLPDERISHTLNDYLWGKCPIQQAYYDLSAAHGISSPGKLYLAPASPSISEIMRMLREPYNAERLNEGVCELLEALKLDFLFLDAVAGVNEDTLFAMALSNALIVVLRPDKQEYQGTAVTVEVARNLGDVRQLLVFNDAPQELDLEQARRELEITYNCEVAALLPHSEGMAALASSGVLALKDPTDPYVVHLRGLVERLLA
ncbi:MAG: MinD/ParA family protein [Anaerolineales bacterium]|nr:MinD/ParA family protein [Anaerolineales bacterium]